MCSCFDRFANSLPINDPLQTVYQLMSGRMPAASTVSPKSRWLVRLICVVLVNLRSNSKLNEELFIVAKLVILFITSVFYN